MPAGMIFQSTDLNQRGRAILDAARDSEARLRDKDGLALVMTRESRHAALKTVARSAANLLALEIVLALAPDRLPGIQELGEWTWLREFSRADLESFVAEMREAIILASREETEEPIKHALYAWRVSAESLEDPLRREVLSSPGTEEDWVEVTRPE